MSEDLYRKAISINAPNVLTVNNVIINIDINAEDYPELVSQLTKSAKKHMRSIEFQALKYIAEGLEREGFRVELQEHQEGVTSAESPPITWP